MKNKKQTVLKTSSNYFPVLVTSDFNIYASATSFLPLDLPVVQGISQMTPPHTFKKNKEENKDFAKVNKQTKTLKPKHCVKQTSSVAVEQDIHCWLREQSYADSKHSTGFPSPIPSGSEGLWSATEITSAVPCLRARGRFGCIRVEIPRGP